MKGYKDFIVHVPSKDDGEIKTKSGVVIYADPRYSKKHTANNVFEVVETPHNYDGPIRKGCRLLVDPTLMMEMMYQKTGKQDNIYLIDREKSHYKVEPGLIVAWSKGEGTVFNGFRNNLIVEIVEKEYKEVKMHGIIVPDIAKRKDPNCIAKIIVLNEHAKELGLSYEDEVYINKQMAIDIKMPLGKATWIRTKDVLAIKLKETA